MNGQKTSASYLDFAYEKGFYCREHAANGCQHGDKVIKLGYDVLHSISERQWNRR